jgi:BrnA antitoxin of type II toxin-antitoxin system
MKREYDFGKEKRGAMVRVPRGKTRITIRLDEEILAWFRDQAERAGGGNYQTAINEALRPHMLRAKEPLEKTLRRVIREELGRASQVDEASMVGLGTLELTIYHKCGPKTRFR